jgi:hypothetical protein
MIPPDWNEIENLIYNESVAAIDKFTKEHASEEVCYFAYDSEPYYEYVLIAIDTSDNSLSKAKYYTQTSIERVKEFLQHDRDWQMAKATMISANTLPFTNNTGDFKYRNFAEIKFEGWQEFADSEIYPQGEFEDEGDDYLEGNLAIIFWKVIDRLIQENQFSKFQMSSPFYLGYGFHDEDQILLRILNW